MGSSNFRGAPDGQVLIAYRPVTSAQIPGVGTIATRWIVTNVDTGTKFIRVRSEGTGVLARGRSRAEFTTYRTCTTPVLGCLP